MIQPETNWKGKGKPNALCKRRVKKLPVRASNHPSATRMPLVLLSQRLHSLESSGLSSQCGAYAGGKILGLGGCSFKSCILFWASAIIWGIGNDTEVHVCLFNTGQAVSVYLFISNTHNIHSGFHNLCAGAAAKDVASHLPLVQTMPGDVHGFLWHAEGKCLFISA